MKLMMRSDMFKDKKVLVMGLGVLGGGIATTKWLVKHGADVTVTDLRSRGQLKASISELGEAGKKVKFVLGGHRKNDFKTNDIIVVNPAVRRESEFLAIAKKSGARLENEASLFFRFCKNPIIAVTGTRGKTTTANWIHFLLKKKFPKTKLTGNSSDRPMLGVLDGLDGKTPVVIELSSWHLELMNQSGRAPEIAIITNVYRDHMNRYRTLADYASAKASVFKSQKTGNFLILNRRNAWTKFFLRKKPKSKIFYFPTKTGLNEKKFADVYGSHNLENFQAAFLAAKLAAVPVLILRRSAWRLPQIKFREEVVFRSPKLTIVNDTTATSPDGAIAALQRFRRKNIFFIAGGTDKNLEYGKWAQSVGQYAKRDQVYLLNGSATKKMLAALKRTGFFGKIKPKVFEDLKEILRAVKKAINAEEKGENLILFSPGAASFEKFRNEFDRGVKFSKYAKKIFS